MYTDFQAKDETNPALNEFSNTDRSIQETSGSSQVNIYTENS